ncbi:MAG: type II toxin-antitoxin system PemK/MazF family toxin [Candidatus Sumerlaeota bacterium]|nr:type II toxin-antitoxin system PemK/MazF family toxin [Candidatus Sumerlaeota bacterium]
MAVADFPGVTGAKRRPVVILSSEAYHTARPDVIVGLITTRTADAAGPTDCFLTDWEVAGLRRPSAFRAFLVTLPVADISGRIGRLSAGHQASVFACVRRALAPAISGETL